MFSQFSHPRRFAWYMQLIYRVRWDERAAVGVSKSGEHAVRRKKGIDVPQTILSTYCIKQYFQAFRAKGCNYLGLCNLNVARAHKT
ncbi:hypothetical protein Plhal703r1_c06g0031011 [Plasmopara halstedii]